MKKIKLLALFTALLMIAFTFVACNGTEEPTDAPEASESGTSAPTDKPTDKPNVPAAEGTVPMFVDGAFVGRLIRKDISDDTDNAFYADIRNALKKAVGKTPSITTDFDKENADAPAILLGNTSYPESMQVYAQLENTSAVAKVVGNKYVIAYTSAKGGAKLLQKITALIEAKAASGNLVIDETWNIQLGAADILGYDDSLLDEYIDLPK